MMMVVVVSVVMVLVEGRIESGGRVRRVDELYALRERYELECVSIAATYRLHIRLSLSFG